MTLATWVLALFALVPLCALVNVARSKKRDDQFRSLQRLDSQFNSAAMVSARRETGEKMLEQMQNPDFIRDSRQYVPAPAWPIARFFDRIAVLWADGKVELADVDIAYREYLFRIWSDYGEHLSSPLLQGQYRQLEQYN